MKTCKKCAHFEKCNKREVKPNPEDKDKRCYIWTAGNWHIHKLENIKKGKK